MLGRILPIGVAVAEAFGDTDRELVAAEARIVSRAVEARRREFTTGRLCARQALERLGMEPVAIPSGKHGEPLWPAGLVGSITHCRGYRAAAAAHASDVCSIGIDAEPAEPLPAGLLADVALPEERAALAGLAGAGWPVPWDRLLFSAKESLYKACFPLGGRRLGFEDAVVEFDPGRGRFTARLRAATVVAAGRPLRSVEGRWLAERGLLVTAVVLSL